MTEEMKPRYGLNGRAVAYMPDSVYAKLTSHPRIIAAVKARIAAEEAHRRHMASPWYRQQKPGKRF